MKEKIFMCECSSEGILISKDEDPELCLAIFSYGKYRDIPPILDRIKYAFWHIRTGKKYLDEIVLSKDTAIKLANYIKKLY